jgi:crotonobetainyl-CoA:carnitine CoA-transferase CaiB-like acyl-CoA transferase
MTQRTSTSRSTLAPLSGVRVLEIGSYLAGPFCGTQLADLGAEVIKLEDPKTGDHMRDYGPFINGESSSFMRTNRNKKSLAVDLKAEEGKKLAIDLVPGTDILVENMRPGAMKRLGLDYATLSKINPRLIYVAASGWGQDGALSEFAGLDIMAQARSGIMSVTGQPDGEPAKAGVPLCDVTCAIYAALGAVAALRARDLTGEGQMVDVSLFETGVSFAQWEAGRYFATGEVPKRSGSAHNTSAPYQAFRSADGWFTLGAPNTRAWQSLCRVLRRDDLLHDSRFVDENARFANRSALAREIESTTKGRATAEWIAELQAAGVACSPIHDYGQVFEDEALEQRNFFWDAPHATAGDVRQLASPMRLSRTPTRRDRAGPLLGEHTEEIVRELGRSEAELKQLAKVGVIRIAKALQRAGKVRKGAER